MCYAEYNQGKDSFPDQENKLYWDLMDNKEVTEEIIEKLEKELRLVQQENQNLKEDTGDIEALNEESSKVLGDIKGNVEKILKGSLDSIPSPSPSVKIQIVGWKVCLRCKGKTLLGVVNKLLKTKSLLTSPSNVLPYYLK